MRYLSRLHKEYLLNTVIMSYPETENTYNTLIESKIYHISFVISFTYIAISNCTLDTIFL